MNDIEKATPKIDDLFGVASQYESSHNQGARYSIQKHADGMPMFKILPSDKVGFDWVLYRWCYMLGAKKREYHDAGYHSENDMIDYMNVLIERYEH